MARPSTAAAVLALALAPGASAQEVSTGLELAGLPFVIYDSDEGYGYGFLGQLDQHGDGSLAPYVWSLQPKVHLTTGRRRDVTLSLDAPGLLPDGWRLSGRLGLERRSDAPYYGFGNASPYDASLAESGGSNPRFYAYRRLRRLARADLQRSLAGSPLRALFGVGLVSNEIDPSPDDGGATVLAGEIGDEVQEYWSNFVRAGLVWDTRDRETAPRSGTWSEVLVQWVEERFGADLRLTRWTLVDRRYWSLSDRVVIAHRWLLQAVSDDAPIEQLQRVETSFEEGGGLGGSFSVRGLLENRYTGRGLLVWNAELRWRILDFELIGRSFHVAASAFLDHGRVWSGAPRAKELFSDLHRGYGGGLHGGMGESFVASMYLGSSAGTGLRLYLDLGYPF